MFASVPLKRLTDEQERELYEYYRDSQCTIAYLSERYSIHESTVYNIIRRLGHLRSRRRFTEDEALEMWRQYEYGQTTVKEIAQERDAPESTIYGTMRRVGPIRGRKKAAAIIACNPALTNAQQFGHGMLKWRQQRRFSQSEAAIEICISKSTYSNYERGHYTPSFATIIRIAKAFQVNPARLFDEVETQY